METSPLNTPPFPLVPDDVRGRFNGQLDGCAVVAWSEFDLDDDNRFAAQYAVLTDDRLLIVDEARRVRTVLLSEMGEAKIIEGLGVDRLVEGRTTFAIAHRLSTLQAADRLVVLEKGKVVEQGLHSELAEKPGGVYAKLHQTQLEMNQQVGIR